jgi:hypothetical protein
MKWQKGLEEKNEEKRRSINMVRRVEEKKECKFSPQIIGFEYNNSGLPYS